MSWLERDPAVQHAPERMSSSPMQRYSSANGMQRASAPDSVHLIESWLRTSRSVIDFWQMAIRQQQDAIVETWRNALSISTAKPAAQTKAPGS